MRDGGLKALLLVLAWLKVCVRFFFWPLPLAAKKINGWVSSAEDELEIALCIAEVKRKLKAKANAERCRRAGLSQ
jgi:hypothetical protein